MTKTNRRFPFQRTHQPISLEKFSTAEQQLYSKIRQYVSMNRSENSIEIPQCRSQDAPVHNEDTNQLNQFVNCLKQHCRDMSTVDVNHFSNLRQNNLQHWKQVKREWQNYYRLKYRKQQELFDSLLKTSRR